MAKYKQLFLVADTFIPWATVGARAGNREIEACQLNSWHIQLSESLPPLFETDLWPVFERARIYGKL